MEWWLIDSWLAERLKEHLSIANEISQVTVAKSTPRREHCYNLADGNFKAIWNLGYK